MNLASDSYSSKLERLFQREAKWGLDALREVSKRYGEPHRQYKTVHIGGSNGKGSVATKIAKALEKEGYKTGLYTSPHLSCFRERIRINGQMISEDEVVRLLPDGEEGSFFELTTLLMFRWFAEQKVDYGVIEVGLGGRLDATNLILPEVATVTSISLEHTEILGSTLEEIAFEKGGIFKPGVPAVVGPRADFYPNADKVTGCFKNYDEENSAIARRVLEKLSISQSSIQYGLSFRPPCRFEQVRPQVILDVAHNPDGFNELTRSLKGTKVHVVLALSKTKDIETCLQIMNPFALSYIATEATNGRGLEAEELKQKIIASGFPASDVTAIKPPAMALQAALQKKGLVLVTGTFFIMADVRKHLGILEPHDIFNLNEREKNLPKR